MKRLNFFRRYVCNAFIGLIIVSLICVGFAPSSVAVTANNSPIYKGSSNDKVSLMVNVYWGDEYLDEMLQIFKMNGVKTTFFVGGSWVRDNEESFIKIIADGHEVGNHGFFHKQHDKLSFERNLEEISATHNLVKTVCDVNMTLFAPPSGAFSDDTLLAASKLGYATVMWSKDTIDWRDQDVDLIFRRATKNISGGDLVLMHPTAKTVAALDSIIKEITENSLSIATVSEVIYPREE